jgi:hypothetical protein
MHLKPKFLNIVFWVALIVLILLSFQVFLNHFIQKYIESKLVLKISEITGADCVAIDVRRIGITGVDLGDFRIGTKENAGFSVSSVQIDYSLVGLFKRQVKRVIISGVELNFEYKDEKPFVSGIDLYKVFAGLKMNSAAASSDISFPVSIGNLEIRNALINLTWEGRPFKLPFEMKATSENTDMTVMNTVFNLYLRGQKIVLKADTDLKKKSASIDFIVKPVRVERFADLIKDISDLRLFGEVDLEVKAKMEFMPFKISSFYGLCELRDGKFISKNIVLQNSHNKGEELPFQIELNHSGGNEWKFSATSLSLISPMHMQLAGIHSIIKTDPDTVESSGRVMIDLKKTPKKQKTPVRVLEPISLCVNFLTRYTKDGKWKFDIYNTASKVSAIQTTECIMEVSDMRILSKMPEFQVSGNRMGSEYLFDYNVIIPNIVLDAKSKEIAFPQLSLKGKAGINNSENENKGFVAFQINKPDAYLTIGPSKVKIPEISFSARYGKEKEKSMHFDGEFKFKDGGIIDSKSKARIKGISGNLPFSWPYKGNGKDGNFSFKTLQWKMLDLGSIGGTVRQNKTGIFYKGEYKNRLLPGLFATFSGNSGFIYSKGFETDLQLRLLHDSASQDIDLGQYLPEAKGIVVNGELEAIGKFHAGGNKIKCSLNSKLNNGQVKIKEEGIFVESVDISLSMPELLKLRSAPKQQIRFKKASFRDLFVTDVKIDFQIESATSFFIEKSELKWCNGHVYTQPLRISPDGKEYSITLFCDRLNLAIILEQFGAAKATGDGTVSGTIPIRYNNGKIRFDDGFLFSSPGEGGHIRLMETEALSAGIPPDTQQFAQLELAKEALKNYMYDWAKLKFITEGEDLLLKMELDGKPAKTLPFVYQKELGGFKKVEADDMGSHFQKIHININFRLPLNKIIEHKELLKILNQ